MEYSKPIKISMIIGILKKHNIKMSIWGCGCCGSPLLKFEYNGHVIVNDEENFNFDMFELNNQGEK